MGTGETRKGSPERGRPKRFDKVFLLCYLDNCSTRSLAPWAGKQSSLNRWPSYDGSSLAFIGLWGAPTNGKLSKPNNVALMGARNH